MSWYFKTSLRNDPMCARSAKYANSGKSRDRLYIALPADCQTDMLKCTLSLVLKLCASLYDMTVTWQQHDVRYAVHVQGL